MKHIYSTLLALGCLVLSTSAFSQTNSVQLQDGGGNLISSHNSIASAYAAIPTTISQAYIMEIMSNYNGSNESYPIIFEDKAGASTTNTITLRPDAGVTSVSISSSFSGGSIIELQDADYMILDGRAGGTGNTANLTVANTATSGSNTNTIELNEGATFNVLQYMIINNSTFGSAARNVAIMQSSNPSGNSDNLIQYCTINCGRYGININGSSAATANQRNRIYGCTLINPPFTAVWIQSNSPRVTIDSCEIYSTSPSMVGDFGIILFDAMQDTNIITKTTIRDIQVSITSDAEAIHVRTANAGTSNRLELTNNFISLTGSGIAASDEVYGFEFSGANAFSVLASHNSIYIGGTCTGSGSSSVGSAAVQITASSSSNDFEGRNNIYVNERTGGSGLQHVTLGLINTNGSFDVDHNTYNVAGSGIARLQTNLITTLAAYQIAVSPNDVNANTEAVNFVSTSDLHLTGSSIGNTNLLGTNYPAVSDDIDNENRSVYYRGADEAILINCSGTPDGGSIFAQDTLVCSGDSFTLTLTNQSLLPGISLQWQSRPVGGTFSNMVNDTNLSITTSMSQATEYRVEVTCSFSGLTAFSDTVSISFFDSPSLDSITFTNSFSLFDFTANGVENANSILWDFGDGSSLGSGENVSHIYFNQGDFTVTVFLIGECDTVTDSVMISYGCNGAPEQGQAEIVNPSNYCPGDEVALRVTGLSEVKKPFYGYQWQSSIDGVSFTNLSGETDSITTQSPIETTHYRCVVKCLSSGDSTASVATIVTVTQPPVINSLDYIQIGNEIDFQLTVTSADSIEWDFGDGNTSNIEDPVHIYTTGSFTVILNVWNNCGSASIDTTVVVTLSVNELESNSLYTVYPNPANDRILISLKGNLSEAYDVRIMDVSGKIVYELNDNAQNTLEISVEELQLQKGMYFVEMNQNGLKQTEPIVIQ